MRDKEKARERRCAGGRARSSKLNNSSMRETTMLRYSYEIVKFSSGLDNCMTDLSLHSGGDSA